MAREALRPSIPRGQRHLCGADFGAADSAGKATRHELPRPPFRPGRAVKARVIAVITGYNWL